MSDSPTPDPRSGVTDEVLATRTIDGVDYVFTLTTLAPGAATGWHTHPGAIYSVVHSGALTHGLAGCSTEVIGPGEPFVDHPGEVHIGRNLGTTPTVVVGLGALPHGAPFATSATDPGCAAE
ncbi:cupin domain-containing protein [Amycolatopsis sp. NPDC051903]|uniref:cupin domain-containing protein n=1 Tax=Amycolatopsis sp. NPDC051903 TaxID=3363936 RepID=UPI0037B87649